VGEILAPESLEDRFQSLEEHEQVEMLLRLMHRISVYTGRIWQDWFALVWNFDFRMSFCI
jgi:hypothetical protein